MAEKVDTVRTTDPAYHKLLDADSRPVPESYRRDSPIEPGPTFVPVSRYTDKAFHDAVLRQNSVPIAMIRAALSDEGLDANSADWRFYGDVDLSETDR